MTFCGVLSGHIVCLGVREFDGRNVLRSILGHDAAGDVGNPLLFLVLSYPLVLYVARCVPVFPSLLDIYLHMNMQIFELRVSFLFELRE